MLKPSSAHAACEQVRRLQCTPSTPWPSATTPVRPGAGGLRKYYELFWGGSFPRDHLQPAGSPCFHACGGQASLLCLLDISCCGVTFRIPRPCPAAPRPPTWKMIAKANLCTFDCRDGEQQEFITRPGETEGAAFHPIHHISPPRYRHAATKVGRAKLRIQSRPRFQHSRRRMHGSVEGVH